MACAGEERSWAMVSGEFWRLKELLRERGYVEGGYGGGTFRVVGQDAAPGWSDWMFEVVVVEDPARPVLAEAEALLGVR